MNVNYIIVILPLIIFYDYVCNVCVMGEVLLGDLMKIQITELAESLCALHDCLRSLDKDICRWA
jgi:hypothetical protein